MTKLRGLFKAFDQGTGFLQPLIPETPITRRVKVEQERQRARVREEQEQARAAAVKVPVEELSLQINAAVSLSLKERLVVYGMSGVGKTTWAKQLITRLLAAFGVGINIIDSKGYHEYDAMATRLHIWPEAPEPAKNGETLVWVIEGNVNLEALNGFLGRILAQGKPCVILADELVDFGEGTPDSYVLNLTKILKQGRFRGIMLVSMTQEYAKMPRNLLGQTNHVLRFHLLNPYDSREVNRIMGLPPQPPRQPPLEPPLPYGFFYRRFDRPSPVLAYVGWQEFFRF